MKDFCKAKPKLNITIHVLSKMIKDIVSSAEECEIVASFRDG